MASKKRAKSNGKGGINNSQLIASFDKGKGTDRTVKAIVKVNDSKMESISAAPLRAKELKSRHRPEGPKPAPKYEPGQLVILKMRIHGTTNVRIFGREWGGDNKNINREQWVYWVRVEGYDPTTSEASPTAIFESDIIQRIVV